MFYPKNDIKGQTLGEYTVVEFSYNKNSSNYWKCKCNTCGKVLDIRSDRIKNRFPTCHKHSVTPESIRKGLESKKIEKKCIVCGESFSTIKGTSKYCSKKCYREYINKENRSNYIPKPKKPLFTIGEVINDIKIVKINEDKSATGVCICGKIHTHRSRYNFNNSVCHRRKRVFKVARTMVSYCKDCGSEYEHNYNSSVKTCKVCSKKRRDRWSKRKRFNEKIVTGSVVGKYVVTRKANGIDVKCNVCGFESSYSNTNGLIRAKQACCGNSCVICGGDFNAHGKTSIVCSDECSKIYMSKRHREYIESMPDDSKKKRAEKKMLSGLKRRYLYKKPTQRQAKKNQIKTTASPETACRVSWKNLPWSFDEAILMNGFEVKAAVVANSFARGGDTKAFRFRMKADLNKMIKGLRVGLKEETVNFLKENNIMKDVQKKTADELIKDGKFLIDESLRRELFGSKEIEEKEDAFYLAYLGAAEDYLNDKIPGVKFKQLSVACGNIAKSKQTRGATAAIKYKIIKDTAISGKK